MLIDYNSSKNFTGTSNSSSFNVTNILEGTYVWNCLWSDVQGNSDYAASNHSLTIGGISVSLISPVNNSYTNINNTDFEKIYRLIEKKFSTFELTPFEKIICCALNFFIFPLRAKALGFCKGRALEALSF